VQTNAVAASKKSPQLGPMDLGDPAWWHMHTGKMTEPCRLMWCFLKTRTEESSLFITRVL